MGAHFQSVGPLDVSGIGWRGLDLYFERVENPPPPVPEAENLRRSYESAVQKLHYVARTEHEFMAVFNEIVASAESSLVAPRGTVDDGNDRLTYIKGKILDLGRSRRRRYFFWILVVGTLTSVAGLILWAAAFFVPRSLPLADWGYTASYQSALSWLVPGCLILPGASLGIVFIGFATNRLLSYESVGRMDRYDFVPWERFMWVILIAYVLLAALWFDVFVVGLGNIVLNKVTSEPGYGFLIGLVCGVAESLIAELLMSRLQPVIREVPA
jgi:hypothetical protein